MSSKVFACDCLVFESRTRWLRLVGSGSGQREGLCDWNGRWTRVFEVEWSSVEHVGDWQYVNECFEKAGIRWGGGCIGGAKPKAMYHGCPTIDCIMLRRPHLLLVLNADHQPGPGVWLGLFSSKALSGGAKGQHCG